VKLLLDTHAFLWFVTGDARFGSNARSLMEDPQTETFVSPASYWEIAIKVSIGKYRLNTDFEEFWQAGIDGNGFALLPVSIKHASVLTKLPFHHRDPFDRLLIAQAMVENANIVSADSAFGLYPVKRVW